MRFIDILETAGVIPTQDQTIPVFDASAIARELDLVVVEEVGGTSYPPEYFGFVAPPFVGRPFWIEATTTLGDGYYSDDEVAWHAERQGISVGQLERSMEAMAGFMMRRGLLCRAWQMTDEMHELGLDGGLRIDLAKWVIGTQAYMQVDKNRPFDHQQLLVSSAIAYIAIGHDGHILRPKDGSGDYAQINIDDDAYEALQNDPTLQDTIVEFIVNSLPFTFLTISFLHRRTMIDRISPNRIERKRAARAQGQKRGVVPLRDYFLVHVKEHRNATSVLSADIRPMRMSGAPKTGHSVRGHLRRVPDEGLFGKGYKAGEMIWIPDHERGTGKKMQTIYLLEE